MKKNTKRFIEILLLTVLIAFQGLQIGTVHADTAISWGLKPNTNERTPEPPAGSEILLKENDGFFVADTEEKNVYFTFDLGYEAGYTASVLDILKENNIKAIFFLCGNYLKENTLITRMKDEGHYIGNHTDKHKDLPRLSDEGINKELDDFQNKFTSSYGGQISFFRPPQGRFDTRVLKIAKSKNLKTALWSIAIVDWNKIPLNAQTCADKVVSRLHPGAVILFHISNSGTPEMLKLLLPKTAEKGYIIGSPEDLV